MCCEPAPVAHPSPSSPTALLHSCSPILSCSFSAAYSCFCTSVGLFPGDHSDCAQQPVPRDSPAGRWWPAADVNLMPGSNTSLPWNMRVSHSSSRTSCSSSRRRKASWCCNSSKSLSCSSNGGMDSYCRRVYRDHCACCDKEPYRFQCHHATLHAVPGLQLDQQSDNKHAFI